MTLSKQSMTKCYFARRVAAFLTVIAATIFSAVPLSQASADGSQQTKMPATGSTSGPWRYLRLSSPDRVVVSDDLGTLATFTVGSVSVAIRGTKRTFSESTTSATVTSKTWVRLLPRPFTGTVSESWLTSELNDRTPDVLTTAAQYITGATQLFDASGRQYAGDASYGPLQSDGSRQEGSDFNDYLGVSWQYPGYVDAPDSAQFGALDCSGFVRMVFGYRASLSMVLSPDGVGLPRRAVQMYASAPGTVLIDDKGTTPTQLKTMLPGDLVFFDASADDGTAIDHVGLYVGMDNAGAPRFVSSRKTVDGPTLGDVGGRSILTGSGYYATAFRAVRRL